MYTTIRELAGSRRRLPPPPCCVFCRKLQCEGYSEFRVRFKLYLEQSESLNRQIDRRQKRNNELFKSVNNDEFDELPRAGRRYYSRLRTYYFCRRHGTSGALAKLMAHASSPTSVNFQQPVLTTLSLPVTNDMAHAPDAGDRAFRLWRDGRNLRFASQFSLHHCKVMSITSHEHSRLAKLADLQSLFLCAADAHWRGSTIGYNANSSDLYSESLGRQISAQNQLKITACFLM